MELNEKIFQAIKKDDIKQFRSCMETSNCGPLRLGRFPVLSVMYLYNSRRILRAYEKAFIKLNSWRDVGEPPELSGKLRAVAGKCLRIYLNEIVTPIEMLLLLDNNAKVTKVYQLSHVAPPVKQRLKDIYYIKWGLTAEFVRNKIILQRRPMTYAEKLTWLKRAVCALLCLAVVVTTPFVVNAFVPFIPDTVGALNVVSWSQIRFNSNKTFALKNDVTVPQDFFAEEMNCTLIGNGHTVTVTGNGLFGNLNGKLSDVVFETNGSPIVQTVKRQTETVYVDGEQTVRMVAKAKNVTVNATVDMTTDTAVGFFAKDNVGAIDSVTVNVSGSLTAVAPEQSPDGTATASINCGGIVANNLSTTDERYHYYPQITNCVANYDNFTLTGAPKADFAFGGIVGLNEGNVVDCQTSGDVTSDTFDVAGICAENDRWITACNNSANLTQTTSIGEWNPIASGIVLVNLYVVNTCVNSGTVTAVSTAPAPQEATDENMTRTQASGIAYVSYGVVRSCYNYGQVVAQSLQHAIAGGIVGTNYWQIGICKSLGSIQAVGKVCYAGGIVGYAVGDAHNNFGYLGDCIALCDVTASVTDGSGWLAAAGGIIGYMAERPTEHNGGSMTYCYFLGNVTAPNGAYVGGIVGALGDNAYKMFAEGRKDDSGTERYFNFNYYADSCGAVGAFGATVTAGGTYATVNDIGVQRGTKQQIESSNAYQETLELFEEQQRTFF